MLRRLLAVWLLAVCCAVPGAAGAQELVRGRVGDQLELTDRRIELAATLVAESGAAGEAARLELEAARTIQARARSAFDGNQLRLASTATLEARGHADRAVALVRGLPDPDRVQVQVERTRDLIERARERLDACDNPRALSLLRVAQDMQGRAEGAIGASQFLRALQLTTSARERVQRAMRLCRIEISDAEATERALQRTDEVIARATDALAASTLPGGRGLLDRARSLQAQAHAEARLQHPEAALRMTQGARVLALRVLAPGRGRLRAR